MRIGSVSLQKASSSLCFLHGLCFYLFRLFSNRLFFFCGPVFLLSFVLYSTSCLGSYLLPILSIQSFHFRLFFTHVVYTQSVYTYILIPNLLYQHSPFIFLRSQYLENHNPTPSLSFPLILFLFPLLVVSHSRSTLHTQST